MKKNVGSMDKILRIIIGIGIMAVGYFNSSWLGLLGLIPLGTAFLGTCPAYLPFGINTCKTEKKS